MFTVYIELTQAVSWKITHMRRHYLRQACLYGLHVPVYYSIVSALTSYLFSTNPEPAFAHYHMGRCLAMSFMFGVSPRLCFDVKTAIFLALVVLATLTYAALETRLKLTSKHDNNNTKIVLSREVDDVTVSMTTKQGKGLGNLASLMELRGSLAGSLSGSCANVNIQS